MPADPRDFKLDFSSAPTQATITQSTRPYLGVQFACCGVYQRVYRAQDGRSYQGRCPKCLKAVNFAVGQGGTDCRTFIVR